MAKTLFSQHNLIVIVIDARNRVGGRLLTAEDGGADLGGAWGECSCFSESTISFSRQLCSYSSLSSLLYFQCGRQMVQT